MIRYYFLDAFFLEMVMTQDSQGATQANEPVQTLRIDRELVVDAPPAVVFEAIFEEIEGVKGMDQRSMGMKIERWPGGRWFRDLGENGGHLWGHVQVIKPPTLLELYGPMMMSYPAMSHLQYRVVAEGSGSRLKFKYGAMGLIDPQHAAHMPEALGGMLEGMKARAEKR
jgi:hypothetical protein